MHLSKSHKDEESLLINISKKQVQQKQKNREITKSQDLSGRLLPPIEDKQELLKEHQLKVNSKKMRISGNQLSYDGGIIY